MKFIAFILTVLAVYFFWAAKKQREASGQIRTGNTIGFVSCLIGALLCWGVVFIT